MRFALPLVSVLLNCYPAVAQSTPARPVDPELPSVLIDVPRSPSKLANLNAGLTLTSIHDSASGWYTLMTPTVAYSFSPRLSADISMPVYLYRLAETTEQQPNRPDAGPTETPLEPHEFDPGDVMLAGHVRFEGKRYFDVFTPSMTLPSGDSNDGLSTGRVTFDLDDHFQLSLPKSALLVDLGGGDSSTLIDPLVVRNYASLGPLAHFQLGLLFALPFRSLFQSVAYEQLPLGDGKIYTTLRRPGFPDQTVVTGRSVSEDNGFTSSLAIPINSHLSLQGFYNRSLRLRLDSVGMGFTFAFRRSETYRLHPVYP